MTTLRFIVEHAHEIAVDEGRWDEGTSSVHLAAQLALIHSEVSEALECVRDRDMQTRVGEPAGKPEGLPIELADIVLRVADLAGALGIDLEAAVLHKLQYNRTRQHRHGGRAL